MKETKISKKNVEGLRKEKISPVFLEEHKQTCQRDVPKLKKLKHLLDCCTSKKAYQDYLDDARELVDEKLEDKEQAIKLYDDAGI